MEWGRSSPVIYRSRCTARAVHAERSGCTASLLERGDVFLVEGNKNIAGVIKYLTQIDLVAFGAVCRADPRLRDGRQRPACSIRFCPKSRWPAAGKRWSRFRRSAIPRLIACVISISRPISTSSSHVAKGFDYKSLQWSIPHRSGPSRLRSPRIPDALDDDAGVMAV